MPKQRPLSEGAKTALDILRKHGEMTLAEMKEHFPSVNSSHLTALRNRDLVESKQVEKEVETVVTRKVNSYTALEIEESTDEPTE